MVNSNLRKVGEINPSFCNVLFAISIFLTAQPDKWALRSPGPIITVGYVIGPTVSNFKGRKSPIFGPNQTKR